MTKRFLEVHGEEWNVACELRQVVDMERPLTVPTGAASRSGLPWPSLSPTIPGLPTA